MENEARPQVKKVVLPGGKTIEVVLFPKRGGGAPALDPPAEPVQDLSVCVSCACEMVFPADWAQAGPASWSVVLCCPNCGHERKGTFSQDNVDRFDEQLDEGAEVLAREYRRLFRRNLSEEIDRFVAALRVDAVLPEDF